MSGEVTPFRIRIPESELRDLREGLERTRWPEGETVTDWSQGVPLTYLRELCGYWADSYDWRATEGRPKGPPPVPPGAQGAGAPLPPPPLAAPRPPPAGHPPRLARLDRGVPEGDRAAHRPHRPRRPGRRLLPRGVPVAAGVRLHGKTGRGGGGG